MPIINVTISKVSGGTRSFDPDTLSGVADASPATRYGSRVFTLVLATPPASAPETLQTFYTFIYTLVVWFLGLRFSLAYQGPTRFCGSNPVRVFGPVMLRP